MTTPALNEEILQSLFYTVRFNENGESHTYLNQNRKQRRQRPASVNNPRRADKTRAPSNWKAEYGVYEWFRGHGALTKSDSRYNRYISGVVGTGQNNGDWMPNLRDARALLNNLRLSTLSTATDSTKQLSAALAQAKQTANMVGNGARDLANSLNGLMQGPKGLARQAGKMAHWKKLPSKYLEWLYGWRPLGDDIANAFDKLNSFKDLGFGYQMVLKQRKRINQNVMHDMSWMYGNGQTEIGQVRGLRTIQVGCTYRFDLPLWFVQNTPTISPWGPIWELTPYSFVLDWFVPIGDWIGSMEAAQFSPHFTEGSESVTIRDLYQSGSISVSDGQGRNYSASGRGRIDCLRTERIAIKSFPQTVTSPPALNPLPGLQQAAQGLSLLSQAFNRWR